MGFFMFAMIVLAFIAFFYIVSLLCTVLFLPYNHPRRIAMRQKARNARKNIR